MQTLAEIRELLSQAGRRPNKRLGQCFLVDKNLLAKLLELADVQADVPVLEVGPGTGTLTEELLLRARRVVAVEIDRGLAEILAGRLGGREGFELMVRDVLAGKHELAGEVLNAVAPRAVLVSNLPYSVATPLIAECLLESWSALKGAGRCRFDRLTFTVQKEVADRLTAGPGSDAYGPVSVLVGLLGQASAGPVVPATSFWPRPSIASRMLRIDLDVDKAARLADAAILRRLLALGFQQRRKQLGSIVRSAGGAGDGDAVPAFGAEAMMDALHTAGIDPHSRAEQVPPDHFAAWANALARGA